MNNYILSILIPTKNRSHELKFCLRSLRQMPSDLVEIIICDNSDDDSAKQLLLEDGLAHNFKYVYFSEPLTVSDNFGRAVANSTGEYVTMIGDDDSIHIRIAEVVLWMKSNDVDGLVTDFSEYYWPGVNFKYYGNKFSGLLSVPNTKGPKVKILNASDQLFKCLNLGCTDLCLLPRMYYGVVRRSYLDQIKKIAGAYIPGPSPDMANAVSLSLVMNQYLYCNIPLFIAGNSTKSAGGLGASKKHVGDLTNKPWLPIDIIEKWPKYVPRFWSGPTIWCESAIKAIVQMKKSEMISRLNGYYLHAKCNIFHKEYSNQIKDSYTCYKALTPNGDIFSFVKYYVAYIDIWKSRGFSLLKKVPLYIRFLPTGHKIKGDLKNIEEAASQFNSMIEVNSIIALLDKKVKAK